MSSGSSRPWGNGEPARNNDYTGLSPMDRWQVESARDQPYHAIAAAREPPRSSKKKAKKGSSGHKASAGSRT
ncbi:hypothetical protein PG990_004513 [Apiospora arundinis]|uniref:Uncharacterized protein n=1 Tax=Apiospora arundinis TaxID=335852 RepID=A0ABR2J5K3_9PEZI